jgi:hypothetical protein
MVPLQQHLKSAGFLKFRAQINPREALSRTIDWTRNNLDQIEACSQRHAEAMALLESRE